MSISDEVRPCPLCGEEREIKQLYYHLQIYHNKSELAEQLTERKDESGYFGQSDELTNYDGSMPAQNRGHGNECDDEYDTNPADGDDSVTGAN